MSLREYDHPADRIRQHRQVSKAPLVVVEGPNDVFVLRDHLSGVEFFPVDGKPSVLSTAHALISADVKGFVCIVDEDFDDPSDLAPVRSVVVPYDEADLEAMLTELGVLAHVLEAHASGPKLNEAGGAAAVVKRAKDTAGPVSSLRLANRVNGWGLRFDRVDLSTKISRSTLELDLVGYCMALHSASDAPPSVAQLISTAQGGTTKGRFRGRDVICIAGTALRSLIASMQHPACAETVLVAQVHSSAGLHLARSRWLGRLQERLKSEREIIATVETQVVFADAAPAAGG